MFCQPTVLFNEELYAAPETVADVAPPVVLADIHLGKMLSRPEYVFLQKCHEMIGELTGEEFASADPQWLHFANMRLELDGHCDRLKMAVELDFLSLYRLPVELEDLYYDRDAYAEFVQYVNDARLICCAMNGVALIHIPRLMSDDELREYLRNSLHRMTAFRVWVGSPRCKCPAYPRCD